MNEGGRMLAGEAILNRVATIGYGEDGHSELRNADESSRVASADGMLEGLVQQHSRLVYRIAFAVLRQHHDAEDATQETFLRVLRYNSKLTAVEDPKTWLARIAWRVAVDRSQQRSRKREIPLENPGQILADMPSSETTADESIAGGETGELLERLIAALPGKLREPLILSTIEEMSPTEVAATLGINEAAVRSRVFRARLILKEKLAGRIAKK